MVGNGKMDFGMTKKNLKITNFPQIFRFLQKKDSCKNYKFVKIINLYRLQVCNDYKFQNFLSVPSIILLTIIYNNINNTINAIIISLLSIL